MQFLGSVKFTLAASLFLALTACSRIEASDPSAPAQSPAPAAQKLAVATAPSAPAASAPSLSLVPTQPGGADLDAFEQTLRGKLDSARMVTRPAPGSGTLHIPNGHVAHAAVLVRAPDGTLRRECISSPAEASALVNQMRNGAAQ
jgi:hypothetical protein